ncbi:SDR family oxidoreductase [Phaeodactylibacter sp.]|uniref:SDR family oxidoreductase n=1 Tax=Phaeodactylibacter sp. TaxID=1940289 RepID=UPI0025F6A47C|nr:SDR family oxidoreductase [Phaeodactylibacter sp.]MCI4651704.1 SDR family oxidoreductase [Phaeodactylibacter sp.]MCI5090840.1 SDR family oxidoreductase [Phaeodactylibacter sp.]
MKIKDKVAIVAGGTGSVGEGIVKVLLKEGARVIVPVRMESRGQKLKNYVQDDPNLIVIQATPSEYRSNLELIKKVESKYGKIDLAVASLGGWYQKGRLDEVPLEDWLQIIENNLNSHFIFAKSLLEYFHSINAGTYIMINGGASEMVVPNAGPMSIIASAQKMMAQVISGEAQGTNIKVYSVAAFTPVITRTRPVGQPGWLKAEDIGEYIVDLSTKEKNGQTIHKIPQTS